MHTEQRQLSGGGWSIDASPGMGGAADLVFTVGMPAAYASEHVLEDLQRAYPQARLICCSAPMAEGSVDPDEPLLVAVALSFEHSHAQVIAHRVTERVASADVGRAVGRALAHEDLRHVFVLGGGPGLEGQALAAGLGLALPPEVSVAGCLVDGGVGLDGPPDSRVVIGIGLRGARLDLVVTHQLDHPGTPPSTGPSLARRLGQNTEGHHGRFAMLFAAQADPQDPAHAGLAQEAQDALGSRVALITLQVREVLARCDGLPMLLASRDGLALAALGESRSDLEP